MVTVMEKKTLSDINEVMFLASILSYYIWASYKITLVVNYKLLLILHCFNSFQLRQQENDLIT